jgi:hypothetical protein
MKIEQAAIDTAAKLLLDRRFWNDCKMFASDAAGKTELSGDEKRNKVKADLIIVFGDIGSVFVHLGIELAVAWLKSQQTPVANG